MPRFSNMRTDAFRSAGVCAWTTSISAREKAHSTLPRVASIAIVDSGAPERSRSRLRRGLDSASPCTRLIRPAMSCAERDTTRHIPNVGSSSPVPPSRCVLLNTLREMRAPVQNRYSQNRRKLSAPDRGAALRAIARAQRVSQSVPHKRLGHPRRHYRAQDPKVNRALISGHCLSADVGLRHGCVRPERSQASASRSDPPISKLGSALSP
jgi:hypothetical protein